MSISRREFLGAGAAAAAGLTIVRPAGASAIFSVVERGDLPAVFAGRPAVVSSANGIRGVAKAYEMLMKGADPLDAALAGVNIQELDPNDQSVGLGGLPNEEGVVQLDASCMHGPSKRAGAVGALEGIATPSLVAKAIMEHTDHIFLVGQDAKKFALRMGFNEQNLLTEQSRQDWLKWKASSMRYQNYFNMPKGDPAGRSGNGSAQGDPSDAALEHAELAAKWTHGTINMNAVTASGDIGSVTTTSGLSWKIPGRVGDSPIIGAGQYCDNTVGAAGSTGRGEANIKACGAFLAVELMRNGASPEAALMKVMERVIALTEPRLLDEHGRPRFDLQYYAIAKDGRFAGACAYQGSQYAAADANGARLIDCAYMYKASERPKGPISGTMVKP
ncbi:MAG: N(4)-(beta-N-acetylglucosaminyl)-L-asparaginase [Gemmatimonadota bacterium]|nr:N(4)-(beta-N-acetylglucosaminyl)-L-asparaginase [Gemmatimonadota bacterium]